MYYDKSEKLGKNLTKFSTFCVFVVIFFFLVKGMYDLAYQFYDNSYTALSSKPYIVVCIIIGIVIACYLYKEGFEDFNEYYDYNKKYYYYFFIILLLILCLVIYTGKTSRERIFKQREIYKEQVENRNDNH